MATLSILMASLIVVSLAVYAGYLHWQIDQQGKARASELKLGEEDVAGDDRAAQYTELRKGIYVLADALLDEKLTHTEGCLRISAMAAHLNDQERFREEYGILFHVSEATAHIPILDAWHALDKKDQRRFDQERKLIEAKYNEAVIEAAQRIKQHYPL